MKQSNTTYNNTAPILRTGAWVQSATDGLWFYTARPELYQYGGNHKFHAFPAHMIDPRWES